MKKTTIVQTYLNTHNCNNVIVFNWMMYNYNKLQKLFSEPRIYHSDTWYRELEKEALRDTFTVVISGSGMWKVCNKSKE